MSRHEYLCHVRFSDVDVYGHVNNVKYFEYFQEARLAFLAGPDGGFRDPRATLVIARIDVDYRRPVLFRPEPYVVESWITRVGTSSFGLAAEIRDGDTLLSASRSTLVAFDLDTQRSRPLRDVEREQLQAALEA
jgi:acyl-CoA thioester hydrolase